MVKNGWVGKFPEYVSFSKTCFNSKLREIKDGSIFPHFKAVKAEGCRCDVIMGICVDSDRDVVRCKCGRILKGYIIKNHKLRNTLQEQSDMEKQLKSDIIDNRKQSTEENAPKKKKYAIGFPALSS